MATQENSTPFEHAVFPLALAPFEEFMVADDRRAWPMTFFVRLEFVGQVDVPQLRRALEHAVRRHPLLQSRIERPQRGRPRWLHCPDEQPPLTVGDDDERPLRFPNQFYLDLQTEIGLRVWVRRRGADRSEIWFQFHHACCDGIGTYQFLEDLLTLYAADCAGDIHRAELPPLRPELLGQRERLGRGRLGWYLRLPVDWFALAVGMPLLFGTRLATIATDVTPQADRDYDPRALPAWPVETFTADEVAQLRHAVRRQGASINDLLLAVLFESLHRWNAQFDLATNKGMVRVMVPFNLRGQSDGGMPAANVVGMAFIDRPRAGPITWCLLRFVSWQMRLYKWFACAVSFPRICGWARQVCGIEHLTRDNTCYASTVLSNMGRVFTGTNLPRVAGKLQVGDLLLDQVESAPPVRERTPAAVSVVSYAGQMTLVLHYDRSYFTPAAAGDLLRWIAAAVRDQAGLPPSPALTDRADATSGAPVNQVAGG